MAVAGSDEDGLLNSIAERGVMLITLIAVPLLPIFGVSLFFLVGVLPFAFVGGGGYVMWQATTAATDNSVVGLFGGGATATLFTLVLLGTYRSGRHAIES